MAAMIERGHTNILDYDWTFYRHAVDFIKAQQED